MWRTNVRTGCEWPNRVVAMPSYVDASIAPTICARRHTHTPHTPIEHCGQNMSEDRHSCQRKTIVCKCQISRCPYVFVKLVEYLTKDRTQGDIPPPVCETLDLLRHLLFLRV